MDDFTPPPSSLKRRGPWLVLIVGVLILAVAGFVAWKAFFTPPVADVPDAGVEVADAGAPEPTAEDLSAGEALLQQLAKGVLPDAWLKDGDSFRRVAGAVYAVSEGQSPRTLLAVLHPQGDVFIVDEQRILDPHQKKRAKLKKHHSRFFISAKNDARYDKVTALVTSVDAAAVGRMYGKLRPYLETAFREIAPPGKTFDEAFLKAVDRLAAVPISDGPREVVQMEKGPGYTWLDPKLEALKPAEKHLLRMGPKNARAVVKQLQAFRAAMAEAPAPDAGP